MLVPYFHDEAFFHRKFESGIHYSMKKCIIIIRYNVIVYNVYNTVSQYQKLTFHLRSKLFTLTMKVQNYSVYLTTQMIIWESCGIQLLHDPRRIFNIDNAKCQRLHALTVMQAVARQLQCIYATYFRVEAAGF